MPGLGNGDPASGSLLQRDSTDDGGLQSASVASEVNGVAKERRDQEGSMVNGGATAHDPLRNGHPPVEAATTKSTAMDPSGAPFGDEPPPEIEHLTDGYQSMSTLIDRLVQETFNELREVIEHMAEDTAPRQPPTKAHAGVNGSGDDSSANAQKKMRLMKFLQDRRAQFIKTMVLTQWSTQTEEVGRVIDLKIWLDRQRALYDEVWLWLAELKRSLGPAKMPNPDIRTALEALSTGKASSLPDLGYIPPKPLTPQRMLKELRNINVLLSIRLNLHDTVPEPFKNFTIKSGRATFRVPDEYEVDLSIADEDPASQFFFIDIRFAFTPRPADFPTGRLRDALEMKVNNVLQTQSLAGCYRFLHEFVLSHKMNILRRQAVGMCSEKWSQSIRLESVHRTLIVQYWLGTVRRKSWIEVGVTSGRTKDGSTGHTTEPTSRIGVRWFPEAKQADATVISLNLAHLSMESILKHVIALHTTRIFSSIHARLSEAKLYADGALHLEQIRSTTEPWDCQLRIQLTSSTTATLLVEPITGRFALLPASALYNGAEMELNGLRDPAADAARRLCNLRCFSVVDETDTRARCIDLEPWKTLNPRQEDLRRIFPRDTSRVSCFRRRGWRSNWVVAMSISMAGEVWWILEVLHAPIGYKIGDFQRIPLTSTTGKVIDPSYDFLSRLSMAAASMVAHYTNVRTLCKMGVHYRLRPSGLNVHTTHNIPTLLIHFYSLMGRLGIRQWKQWARETLKVTCQSVLLASGQVVMVVEARLMEPVPHFDLAVGRVDEEVVFHPKTGAFAFRLVTAVGEPTIEKLIERLQRVGRLICFVEIIRKFRLKCETISLGRIRFQYSHEPSLRTELVFVGGVPMNLLFPPGNPHLRIQDLLISVLQSDGGLERVTVLLGVTLPLLVAFDDAERTHDGDNIFVLPRTAEWYQLRYHRPRSAFDIRMRQRRDDVRWHVRDDTDAADKQRSPSFFEAIAAFMDESGDGWMSLRTGVAATSKGVADVVRSIDQLVRDHAGSSLRVETDAATTTAAGAPDELHPQPQPQPQPVPD